MHRTLLHRAVVVVALAVAFQPLSGDEGLWLFNRFPEDRVKQKYGIEVTDAFLERLRKSSVRLSSGGSGSFVSPSGLLFTNHHVASDCIQKLTTAENNYMRDGFHAATAAEERTCPDLEVNILESIEDVTNKVKGAVPSGAAVDEAGRLRRGAMNRIEKECADATGNRCDVVSLYSGGEYHLYRYKKYTDVRLVFAPEESIAAFGGDPDNFTYPRYCLDIAFFRVYEGGQPAKTDQHLPWSREGVQDGELTFVPGNPGNTGRLMTVAALEFSRDVSFPLVHRRLGKMATTLLDYGKQSEDDRRDSRDNLLGVQNSLKAYTGFLAGLRDPGLMNRKRAEEKRLRDAVMASPKLKGQFGQIWDEVAAAYKEYANFYPRYMMLERNADLGSRLLEIARHVIRYAAEKQKPNELRLREYADASLPSLEQQMFSPAPIIESMEIAVLSDTLEFWQAELGASDPVVKQVLAGKSLAEAARQYVSTSKLADVAERKRLANDPALAAASEDGMIRLARLLDQPARELRKRYEDRVEAALEASAGRIAQACFEVYGPGNYPDATFTLRLSYGPVKGYRNAKGERVPYATRIAGLYRRATGVEPFRLPPRWLEAKEALDDDTPFNFVTTNDTHGGNSGSPTVNTKGEIIGILFDGNLEGLPNRFVYTDEMARSVHVAGQVIIEALRKVYRADRLLGELGLMAK